MDNAAGFININKLKAILPKLLTRITYQDKLDRSI
jgi:hypothetical protein